MYVCMSVVMSVGQESQMWTTSREHIGQVVYFKNAMLLYKKIPA